MNAPDLVPAPVAAPLPGRPVQLPPEVGDNARPPRIGRILIIAAFLIVVGLIAGFVPRWRQHTRLLAENSELAVPTVTVVYATPGKVAAGLPLAAEIKPLIEAPIYARASGYLKRWLVDIGAPVQAGQLLAEIDTPDLNQELARSRAQLAQAQAALALAKITAERWANLLKSASVSEQETAEKQADFELKTATVQAAQADVRRLEELQSFARVTAPFAGTITARKTDVGALVAASAGNELFRLAQTGTLRVFVRVPQSLARNVATGQTAELTIAEWPRRVFTAKVARTAGAMSVDSRTLLTELEVDNSKGEILAGTYGQVRFTQMESSDPLVLPSNTLLFRAEGPQVGVVLEGGKVELRRIVLGRDFGATLEILDGVNPQDRVILNPADALVSGEIVRVAEGRGQ